MLALGREGLDLVGDDEVGVQVGVAGAGVAVVERGGDESGDRDLPDAALADPGERDLALEHRERRADRGVVGRLDLAGDLRRGERPQRGDRLHRAEGQVVPGDGDLRRPGRGREEAGQLGIVPRRPAVLAGERRGGDGGADPGPLLRGDRRVPRQAAAGVVVAERLRDLLAQRGRGEGREGAAERAPSPGGRLRLPGAGVPALAEEQLHLLLGDRVPEGEVEPGEAGPHPPARRLALLLVVARQPGLPDLGRVVGRDLPGQVRVPAPGGELVKSHHIWKSLRGGPSWTCRCGINHFSAPGVFLDRGGDGRVGGPGRGVRQGWRGGAAVGGIEGVGG